MYDNINLYERIMMFDKSGPGSDAGKEPIIPGSIDAPTVSAGKVSAFLAMRIPNFRWLLVGSVSSNAAQWIQQVTLSWLVYDLTGSGTILGTVNLVQSLASVCMIPVAGLLVDRFNRGKLLSAENGVLLVITLTLGLALIFGQAALSYLFIFAFLAGLVRTIDRTLRQVLIFDLVPRSFAPNGVAIVQTGWSLMRVLGPSVGGLLIIWFGAGGNFLVQAGAYALIAITILQIRFPARKVDVVSISVLQNFRDGIGYVAKARLTRTFMLVGVILPLLTVPIFTILPPIYAVKIFGDESGRILGFLMASAGAGGIVGGVITASLGRLFEYRGRLEMVALILLNLLLVAFALSSTLLMGLLFMALAGVFEMVFLVTNQTLLQLSIPDSIRGRVTAILSLNSAVVPLGALLAGVGSDLFGPRLITIMLAGLAVGISVIVLLVSSTIRNYRFSQGLASFDEA